MMVFSMMKRLLRSNQAFTGNARRAESPAWGIGRCHPLIMQRMRAAERCHRGERPPCPRGHRCESVTAREAPEARQAVLSTSENRENSVRTGGCAGRELCRKEVESCDQFARF